MDARWWWFFGIVGPVGAVALIRAVVTSYNEWRASRAPKLTFASCEEVEALEETFVHFIPSVFGFGYDECFISDESSLGDFTTTEHEMEEFRLRIRSVYGVEVTFLSDDRLVTIVKAITQNG